MDRFKLLDKRLQIMKQLKAEGYTITDIAFIFGISGEGKVTSIDLAFADET